MLTKDELLAAACNPLHTVSERESSWQQYETRCWLEAVRKKGLLLTAFDLPCDHDRRLKNRVLDALRAEDIMLPRPLPLAS